MESKITECLSCGGKDFTQNPNDFELAEVKIEEKEHGDISKHTGRVVTVRPLIFDRFGYMLMFKPTIVDGS